MEGIALLRRDLNSRQNVKARKKKKERKENHIPILQAHEFRKKTVPLGIILPPYVISLIDVRGRARRRTVKYLYGVTWIAHSIRAIRDDEP